MKPWTKKEEFMHMQKLYQNSLPKYAHMDLMTFAWNYYNDQIIRLKELRNFWTPEEIKKFFS